MITNLKTCNKPRGLFQITESSHWLLLTSEILLLTRISWTCSLVQSLEFINSWNWSTKFRITPFKMSSLIVIWIIIVWSNNIIAMKPWPVTSLRIQSPPLYPLLLTAIQRTIVSPMSNSLTILYKEMSVDHIVDQGKRKTNHLSSTISNKFSAISIWCQNLKLFLRRLTTSRS